MRQFDQQIVESVALRRQPVRNAVFFGQDRWRRQLQDHIKPLIMGVVFAALIAAGCIATSFVVNLIEKQKEEKSTRAESSAVVIDPRHPQETTGPLTDGSVVSSEIPGRMMGA